MHWRNSLEPWCFRSLPLMILLLFHKTPKVNQIIANPNVQIHWYIEGTREQFRISGKTFIVPSPEHTNCECHKDSIKPLYFEFDWEAKRMAIFKGLSSHMRASWCRPVPGTPLEGGEEEMKMWPKRVDEPGHEQNDDGSEVSEEQKRRNRIFWDMALSRFALVVPDPVEVDYLNMGVVPNRRYRFVKTAGGTWTEQEIIA
ncbi:hypothetical protein L218DRAFT_562892 [Marasmius fiardii PR-910]|nr:hypothetical protein L218DRAFT_562892 [Marasmius fiardii PR-910]